MAAQTYEFSATVWRHDPAEAASWYFLDLPFEVTDEIDEVAGPRPAFGSVRVEVTIGGSTWRTSVFPDGRRRTFVLPVKKAVRSAEGLDDGARAEVRLRLL